MGKSIISFPASCNVYSDRKSSQGTIDSPRIQLNHERVETIIRPAIGGRSVVKQIEMRVQHIGEKETTENREEKAQLSLAMKMEHFTFIRSGILQAKGKGIFLNRGVFRYGQVDSRGDKVSSALQATRINARKCIKGGSRVSPNARDWVRGIGR